MDIASLSLAGESKFADPLQTSNGRRLFQRVKFAPIGDGRGSRATAAKSLRQALIYLRLRARRESELPAV
jgi:hypothetical protein